MTTITVSVDLKVDDERSFRETARDRAISDGLSLEEAALYLNEDEMSLNDCAMMVIDPGESPSGCSILGSSAD